MGIDELKAMKQEASEI